MMTTFEVEDEDPRMREVFAVIGGCPKDFPDDLEEDGVLAVGRIDGNGSIHFVERAGGSDEENRSELGDVKAAAAAWLASARGQQLREEAEQAGVSLTFGYRRNAHRLARDRTHRSVEQARRRGW
jgi:hypothetical protein